jgi:hypothetical protein
MDNAEVIKQRNVRPVGADLSRPPPIHRPSMGFSYPNLKFDKHSFNENTDLRTNNSDST